VTAHLAQIGYAGPRRTVGAAAFSGIMATIGVVVFWGFTVDDALITARVAHHISLGQGYRFNSHGPVVDAVTPLGWAYILAPFAKSGPIGTLLVARWIGVVAWIASASWLGANVARHRSAIWPLALLAIHAPLGLWASAGMETPVVTALVTFATAEGVAGSCCLGIAAAWRPELIPYALVMAVGRCRSLSKIPRELAIVVIPVIVTMLVRWAGFGSPQPLAVFAKPADLSHGFWYALEALLWCGPIWLWLASGWPWSEVTTSAALDDQRRPATRWLGSLGALPGLPRLERYELTMVVAVLVHFAAIGLAGGDWMPAYRLAVPVMPVMLRVACQIASGRGRLLATAAIILATTSTLRIAIKLAPAARLVLAQRLELIRGASRALSKASVVAAPDVGWVGAAFPGEVVDLAGATDPTIAHLKGGHTSKRIGIRLLLSRRVDRVIVLLAAPAQVSVPWTDSPFARAIDYRAALLAADLDCSPTARLDLPHTDQAYLVLGCPRQ